MRSITASIQSAQTTMFDCLVDGSHEYSFKSKKGAVCSHCGVYYIPGCPIGYKSERYSSKVHFNANEFEDMLLQHDNNTRISWTPYLEQRGKMVRFILDKGRLLKMSLKILHLAVHVMDLYCEKIKPKLSSGKDEVIAASALLIAAKSGELDERVPFITKLKKYSNLDQDVVEFKKTEVAIAQSLDWNLQKLPYYSYVEHYLASGILSPQDKVSKKVLDAVTREGLEDTVRLLAREESTRNSLATVLQSLGSNNASQSSVPIQGALSSRSKDCSEDLYAVSLGVLSREVRGELIKVFELYARDLSNLVLRDFPHWSQKKNNVALAIIMYARAAVFDPSQAMNTRLQELSVGMTTDIKDTYTKLANFIRSGESNLQEEDILSTKPSSAATPNYTQNYKSSNTASSSTGSDHHQLPLQVVDPQVFRVSLQNTTISPVGPVSSAHMFHKQGSSGPVHQQTSGFGFGGVVKPLAEQHNNTNNAAGGVVRDTKLTQFRSSVAVTSGSKYASRGSSTERNVYHPLSYQLASNIAPTQAGMLSNRRHFPSTSLLKENK